jgi:hypothetical protein
MAIAAAAATVGMMVVTTGLRRRASRAQAIITTAPISCGMLAISTAWLLCRLC